MNMHSPPVNVLSPAPLKNVAAMVSVVQTLLDRPQMSSGFGAFSGPSGYGKSVASTYAQNHADCVHVEAREFWARKAFCKAMLAELGQKPKGTIPDMMDEIIRVLGNEMGRVLIIDEADKLVDKGMIELARDIQEMTNAPVILVGEERLLQKLKAFERVDNRVPSTSTATPADRGISRAPACRTLGPRLR